MQIKIPGFLKNQWWAVFLISLSVSAVYYNSLHSPFIFDDKAKIVNNPDIKNVQALKQKLIYPYQKKHADLERNDPVRALTYLSLALNYHLGKLNTFGYHLFNILNHLGVAILIFFLTKKIMFYAYQKEFLLFSLLTALFFAVHPVNTEVVTYIGHRAESLAALFYFSALLFFSKTFEQKKYFYILSMVSFVLSLFSKQTAVTLPAILLIFDYIFLSEFSIKKVLQKKYFHIPFWIVLGSFIVFRNSIGDSAQTYAYSKWTQYSYALIQPYIVLKYLKLLFFPLNLCLDHLLQPVTTILSLKTILPFTLMIGIFIALFCLIKTKTAVSKIVVFSGLWFFITLSPTSSIIPIVNAMADRRLYLPGFGFYLLLTFLYFGFKAENAEIKRKISRILALLLSIHILLLGTVTIKRNQLYQNPVLLWKEVVANYPKSLGAHNRLGVFYNNHNEYAKALEEYKKSLKLHPNSPQTYENIGNLYYDMQKYDQAIDYYQIVLKLQPAYPGIHTNLGHVYYAKKEYAKAGEEYNKTLTADPYSIDAYNNLGNINRALKQYDLAVLSYKKALQINPDYITALNNLGLLYQEQLEYGQALKVYQKIAGINPHLPEAHKNLALIYEKQNKYELAILEYKKALKITPDSAVMHNNLGTLYYTIQQYDKALKEYERALEINPEYANIYNNLGLINYARQKYGQAVSNYKKALSIDANFFEAVYNLGLLYQKQKNFTEAIEQYNKALEIKPNFAPIYKQLGNIYYEQKNYSPSLQAIKSYLLLNPDDEEVKKQKQALENLTGK